jgi:hypothetical protein
VQIVKSYYGGRDVTPEDLEMALLVGMSPHERRRLEKKKGYSFKTQAQIIIRKSSNVTTLENSRHDSDNNHALPEQVPKNETESNSKSLMRQGVKINMRVQLSTREVQVCQCVRMILLWIITQLN